jgi:predicted nucleic acid-binding protein
VTAILEDWRSKTVEVTVSGKDRFVTADPGDDIFIECAITAGAETIVSGDRHLKDLGQCSGISILSAAEFLERVLARTEE